ncbi:MAG: PAS domain-containing protein, partial [Elusimicrobia bacterium]|nr:PAS domain-containing protein [Elusimicrobiota bacterium]
MKKFLNRLLWPLEENGPARERPDAAFLAACPQALLVTAPDGRVLFANAGARETLDCADSESLRRFPELLNAASFESYRAVRRACLECPAIGAPPLELTLHASDGDRTIELKLRAGESSDGPFLVHAFHEITDRRRVEERTTRSRDFYLSLLENAPALVWRSGPDGGRNYFNRSWLSFTGRAMDAAFGDRWLDDVHPDDAAACANGWRAANLERRPAAREYRLKRADGEYRVIAEHAAPIFGAHGAFEGFVGFCQDVTDVRRAQETAEEERREEMQRAFVANVSHELRTPVAAIKGFAETLRLGAIDHPKVAGEFVETIERHALRLQRVIEDLLEISLLESGRRRARPEPVRLGPFVWDFCKGLAASADRKKVRLRVDVEPDLVLWADPPQLRQVFENLLDNAIKFNRKGGTVVVEARAAGPETVVSVKDTGPGIAPDQLPVLFDRFLRKTTPSAVAAPSTGLGLSIVKGIVVLHGGSIS